MHLKAKPPIFVPVRFRAEIEKLSKAALMDLCWDFATTQTDTAILSEDAVMNALRERAEIIRIHRSQEPQP